MPASSTSVVIEETLRRLLDQAHTGRIQVPEFQRELTLRDEWIKSLLASISLRYPVGAVMLLRSGSRDLRFEARPVAGAPAASTEPDWLVLDGQRRLAALYQVLASGRVVQTHGEHRNLLGRWYYVDIPAALDPRVDRDEAMISVSEPFLAEVEWERRLFPLRLVFAAEAERRGWWRGFAAYGAVDDTGARGRLMDRFDGDVLETFEAYRVPTILHARETARWSVRVHGGPDGPSLSDRFRAR